MRIRDSIPRQAEHLPMPRLLGTTARLEGLKTVLCLLDTPRSPSPTSGPGPGPGPGPRHPVAYNGWRLSALYSLPLISRLFVSVAIGRRDHCHSLQSRPHVPAQHSLLISQNHPPFLLEEPKLSTLAFGSLTTRDISSTRSALLLKRCTLQASSLLRWWCR